ncbi:hypothetical protein [Streptomyces sp. NBC_01716]|uniref:hypothetical protein n=1 Tax=Streptomyces sp. NBC_01716 TaxID=2975917 RepID=UPI002E3041AB|nr:hypothetical protein [Streptomyces sp. NBC_01716]
MNREMTLERLLFRVRAVPPLASDLLVAACVGLFTAADAAVNDPEYRQADWFTWLLVADRAGRQAPQAHARRHGHGCRLRRLGAVRAHR